MNWIFCPIDDSCQRDTFDCGIPELNEYLKQYARQNDRKGIAKTFVALPQVGDRVVAGYYSVSMSQIERNSLPENHTKGLPRYPVPAMLIGKLAVDKSMQGIGVGEELLVDALKKAVRLSAEVAIFAVRVDAINERANNFYVKYGFIPFLDNRLTLFMPIKVILNAFGEGISP